MIQIRHVPVEIHRTLKARAARSGLTLSGFLMRELRGIAERPTWNEILDRIDARDRVESRFDSAAAVRAERDARR